MTTPPTRIAQTSRQAKKEFRKNGPRISGTALRQLDRAVELENRAAKIRDKDERSKAARKKREEKERREREGGRQMGVGLATQMIGFNHTQARLKRGMEAFVGLRKRTEEDEQRKEAEIKEKLETIAKDMEKEPWDDEDDGYDSALDLPQLSAQFDDSWIDDELDDDTLCDAHDQIMSDTVDEVVEPSPKPQAAPVPPIVEAPTITASPQDNANSLRLHGPINKAVEAILDKLPEPLIELLSQDVSTSRPTWDPFPALLHKLSPLGLPPHRLRIKVGCIVALLRDLTTSSQLSKSSHLRVLRVEQDWVECRVLDGPLEGTTTYLRRIPFTGKYRNEDQYPYQRTQFPIRVAMDYIAPAVSTAVSRDPTQSQFKMPSISGQPPRPKSVPAKPAIQPSQAKSTPNLNSIFKLPGMPASKLSKPPAQNTPSLSAVCPTVSPLLLDGWDDFLESSTQIARELKSEESPPAKPAPHTPAPLPWSISETLPPLSSQDLDFSIEDLDECSDPPPVIKPPPSTTPASIKTRPLPAKHTPKPLPKQPPRPAQNPPHLPVKHTMASPPIIAKHAIPPPLVPAKQTMPPPRAIATPTMAPLLRLNAKPPMPSPPPRALPPLQQPNAKPPMPSPPPRTLQSPLQPNAKPAMPPPPPPTLKRKTPPGPPAGPSPPKQRAISPVKAPTATIPTKPGPPPRKPPVHVVKPTTTAPVPNKPSFLPGRTGAAPPPAPSRPAVRPLRPLTPAVAVTVTVAPKAGFAAKSCGSFSEFGLSTQDAVSFFDDDDDDIDDGDDGDEWGFGSPVVTV